MFSFSLRMLVNFSKNNLSGFEKILFSLVSREENHFIFLKNKKY